MIRRLVASLVAALLAAAVWAQETPDLERFERLAAEITEALEDASLTDDQFGFLRERLDEWRGRLDDYDNVNAPQIETLEAEIASLGPPPAEGESEAEDIAARREELNAHLEELRAPKLAVDAARARATALIGQIDGLLRARQADALFELGPTPLNPALWAQTARRTIDVVDDIGDEIDENAKALDLGERLPVVLALLVVGLVLITRGPPFVERMIERVERRTGAQGRVVWGFVVSLFGVVLPLVGLTLLNLAIITTGVLGETGEAAAIGLNLWIVSYSVARWLGTRVFPVRSDTPSPVPLDAAARIEGRRLSMITGALVGAMLFLDRIDRAEEFERVFLAIAAFPFILLLGLVLWRLGTLLTAAGSDDESEEVTTVQRVDRVLGLAVRIVAVAGPLAAAVGYYSLAEAMMEPMAMTLGLAGFIATLHLAIRAGWGLLRGLTEDEAERALVPVLITLVLSIASLPVFALIWGARRTDLGELWTRISDGVRIGEVEISPGTFLTLLLVFVLGVLATRMLQGTLRTTVLPRTRMDPGARNALVSGLGYVGITLAALVAIMAAGIDLSNLALVIGALGVGIGFGLQNIVNNFVSGIILLIERPISEGDWIEVNGQMGIVKSISVRSTRIETFDRTDVIVPNGDFISGTVTNWTRGNSIGRAIVPVGVAYGSDTHKVEEILMEIAKAHPVVAVSPEPAVLFMGFGADSLDFEIRAILTDVNLVLSVKSDINHEIARRFAEEGIEIPFAQRDIWLRNPETLLGRESETPPAVQREPRAPSRIDPDVMRDD